MAGVQAQPIPPLAQSRGVGGKVSVTESTERA